MDLGGARMRQSQQSRLRSCSAEPPSSSSLHINKTVVLLKGQVEEARLAGSLVSDSVNSGQDGGKFLLVLSLAVYSENN